MNWVWLGIYVACTVVNIWCVRIYRRGERERRAKCAEIDRMIADVQAKLFALRKEMGLPLLHLVPSRERS